MEQAHTRWLVIALVALGGLILGLLLGALLGGLAGYVLGQSVHLSKVQAGEGGGWPSAPTPTPPPTQVVPWRQFFCPPFPEATPVPLPEEIPTPLPGAFGARVERVVPDTPAEEAGLRPGDVIVAVNNDRVTPGRSLADLIARYLPGDEVTLTVRRGNETLELRVRLGEHPEHPGQAYLGIYFTPAWP